MLHLYWKGFKLGEIVNKETVNIDVVKRFNDILQHLDMTHYKFSKTYKIPLSTVRAWSIGDRNPDVERLNVRAGVSIQFLEKGTLPMMTKNVQSNSKLIESNEFDVEQIPVPANASLSYTFNDLQEVYAKVVYAKTYKQVIINGDSMEPEISHNNVALFDTSITAKDGDIVIATYNGILVCKLYRFIDNFHYLFSYNKQYDPIKINNYDDLKIHGVVIQVSKIYRKM